MPQERTIFQALANEIDRLNGKIRMLESARDYAMPAYNLSTSPPQEAVEGQWALNTADDKPWYYWEGAWHQYVCEEATLVDTDIIFMAWPTSSADGEAVYVYSLEAGTVTEVLPISGTGEYYWNTARWSKDGTKIHAWRLWIPTYQYQWIETDPDGSNLTILFEISGSNIVFKETNEGKKVIRNLTFAPHKYELWDVATNTIDREWTGNDNPSPYTVFGSPQNWQEDGERIAFWARPSASQDFRLFSLDLAFTEVHEVMDNPQGNTGLIDTTWFLPDNSGRIICATFAPTPDELFIINHDGTGKTVLHTGTSLTMPVPSPDSSKIAFYENGVLKTINIDGTGLTTIPNSSGVASPTFPMWSSDGTKVVRTCGADNQDFDIFDLVAGTKVSFNIAPAIWPDTAIIMWSPKVSLR